jgi:hypothetical protein
LPGYFDRFTDDHNSAFVRQLHMNTSTYWQYDSPIRFYYRLGDGALHPVLVERALVAGGSKTDGIAVSQADHRGTFLAALYGNEQTLSGKENLLSWFDQHRLPA